MVQIHLKIKKYKAVAGRMRRGTGNEYDEGDMPADLPYFDMLDSVIGSRAAVTPVHLLT